MNYQETFRALAAVAAPSGFESGVLDVIADLARPYASDMHRDALGSLIVHRAGAGRRVMLVTHADTFGMILTCKDDKGFWRFGLLGEAEPAYLVGLPVCFVGGARGVVGCDGGIAPDKLKLQSLYIDVTVGEVRIGDACAAALVSTADERRIVSPALDGRAGCLAALDILSRSEGKNVDLYVVFSAQQTVGERGAGTAAFSVEPETVISLELTAADDTPESTVRSGVKLGGGPALVVRAGGAPANMALVEKLEQAASFPVQRTVDASGRFALRQITGVRAGIAACAVGIPARRCGLMGIADPSDIRQAVSLVLGIL